MDEIIRNILLLLAVLNGVAAEIPNCAVGVRCPPGGIWGEWSTFGNGICKMACGGCAELFQTRKCLSDEIPGCSCVGDSSRNIPCNLKPCEYPIQRSCCVPYLPMVVNGVPTCGPLPKSTRESAVACCPIGGLWSEYSPGYSRVNSQWVRTRRCLSDSIGCPCTGSATEGSTDCPCVQPPSAASACPTVARGRAHTFTALKIRHDTCTGYLEVLGNNDQYKYCDRYDGYHVSYIYVPLVIMKEVGGGCTFDYPLYCANAERVNQWSNVTFTCDTDSKNWIYDYSGKRIESYVTGVFN